MLNTEIIRVGWKIYIITKTTDKTFVTTVGEGSKIEKREFDYWTDMPWKERMQIFISKSANKKVCIRY